jgi:hypothetical protein
MAKPKRTTIDKPAEAAEASLAPQGAVEQGAVSDPAEGAGSAASEPEQTDLIKAIAAMPETPAPAPVPEPDAPALEPAEPVQVTVSPAPTVSAETAQAIKTLATAAAAKLQADAVGRVIIRVTAPAGPRRRAGFAFGPKLRDLTFAEILDAGGVPQEVLKALLADPMLSVAPPPDA